MAELAEQPIVTDKKTEAEAEAEAEVKADAEAEAEVKADAEADFATSLVPTTFKNIAFSNHLAKNLFVQAWYGGAAGFFLYFSMYALRRPFKAAKFRDDDGVVLEWFDTGMTLKTAISIFQLAGYMSSKWLAIIVVSIAKGKQDWYLTALIFIAQISLILFGLTEGAPDYSPFPMFLNGLMLGMVWGLVVAYFEGRTTSDFSLVCLSISFIVSSGIVKDVALKVLGWGYSQFWMPAMVGAMFLPLYLFCTLLLNQLPAPTQKEEMEKARRVPMNHQSRLEYFIMFWPGLLCLWLGVMLLTAYRDYRDTFAVEIFEELGYDNEPGNLSKSESLVAGILLIPIASLVFCQNNVLAFKLSMASLVLGSVLMLLSVYTFVGSDYSGFTYYVLTGVASYLSYVPYNSVLYERLVAVLQVPCNISYLMAVMDAVGYLGVFIVFIVADYSSLDNHLDVFNIIGQVFGFATMGLYILSSVYFFVWKRALLFEYGKKTVENDDDKDDVAKFTEGQEVVEGVEKVVDEEVKA
jgi:hypothetical protein